jgi:GH25 family lysozyme M1 (1,4-beta-N-acetylmuramidase)
MPRLDFIDISHHQPKVDFAKVKAAGIIGVILKATEGTSYTDPTFASRSKAADEAGLAVASYHFLKHGKVQAQIEHYLSTVKPSVGERVVIDYEDTACTVQDLIEAVKAIRETAHDLQITIYGASKLKDDARGHRADLEGTSLWVARYSSKQPEIATDVWPYWSAWQYSDAGRVDGIDGPVDVNTFNGSPENCAKWLGLAVEEPVPVPEPAPPPVPPQPGIDVVAIAISTPPGVRVTVLVNGQPA